MPPARKKRVTGSSENPTFSVVVPTLGRAAQLRGCLAALAGLDYRRECFEVVVVNDGGGRAIDHVAAAWEERLGLTLVPMGGAGPSAARNAGAEHARGRFLAFTDDDCRPESRWLEVLQDAHQANPGCAVGGEMVNGADGRCAAASQAVLEAAYDHFNRGSSSRRFFATSNLSFPADELRALGGFDEEIPFAEDRELCERWVRSGRRLVSAPRAVVRHMRELTLRQFCAQHFRYGRGAWAVHRARVDHGGHFKVEPGFYAALARQVRAPRKGADRASLAVLALTSQLANAAGFAREAFVARRAAATSRRRGG